MPVRHLQIVRDPEVPNRYYLPISTSCLIEDLLSSIEKFKGGLGKSNELIIAWNEAAKVLSCPKEFDFSLP